jgi:xanthosine phosphorylase
MTTHIDPISTAAFIKEKIGSLKPVLGLILGSGLGSLADYIEQPIIFDYRELPGFPVSSVVGHASRLVLGTLNGLPVACLQGRVHSYEGIPLNKIKIMVRTLKLIGCTELLITNAAGSLRTDVVAGNLMLITDHINLQPGNPLIGPNDDAYGPRFFGMEDAYDLHLRTLLLDTAASIDITLPQGIYACVSGPMFETPAEIQAFRILGATAVGMSTVPEVIVARHCGLKVAVLSAITNLAAGMSSEKLSHEGTLYHAERASHNMIRLIRAFCGELATQ